MKTLQEIEPMFQQPELGLLMQALDGYASRWSGESAMRIPVRELIISLAEEGDRPLTRSEVAILRQAVRWFLRRKPQYFEWLEAFLG